MTLYVSLFLASARIRPSAPASRTAQTSSLSASRSSTSLASRLPRPCLNWRRIRPGKFSVANPFSEDAAHHSLEPASVNVFAVVESEGLFVKKVWQYEITDPDAVPREYWFIDERKIAGVVRAGVRSIDGVRIFETEQLAVRSR